MKKLKIERLKVKSLLTSTNKKLENVSKKGTDGGYTWVG